MELGVSNGDSLSAPQCICVDVPGGGILATTAPPKIAVVAFALRALQQVGTQSQKCGAGVVLGG